MNKEYLIYKLSDEVKNSCKIDKEAFTKFNVKRGLRNDDGSGVLVGLTNIGNVVGYERDADGKLTPTEGKLYYRCLLYTSPSPRDATLSRMPSSA